MKKKSIKINKTISIDLEIKEEIEAYCKDRGYSFSEFIVMLWKVHKKQFK